jgi:hypothetical protein
VCGGKSSGGGGGLAGGKGGGVAAGGREVDSRWSAVAGCYTGEKQVRELNKNTCIVCIKTGPNKNRLFYYIYLCVFFTLFNYTRCAFYCLLCLICRFMNFFSTCIFVNCHASVLQFFACLCPGRYSSS